MTIEEMKKRKQELGYSNEKLSEISGVPAATIQKIFSGETKAPRYKTVYALMEALAPRKEPLMLGEPVSSYSKESVLLKEEDTQEMTIDDYLALPEGTRVELIDGKFYDMASPTTLHQYLGAEIEYIFKEYVKRNKGTCVPFIAPTDVQLDRDDKTVLQPDVFVVCDRSKIKKAGIFGAPDLVIEVVSPSNAVVDIFIKMGKYKKAGVREYWIVFPEAKNVVVYDFSKSEEPVRYTFSESVPVAIWSGECRVDFAKIYEDMAFLYDLE